MKDKKVKKLATKKVTISILEQNVLGKLKGGTNDQNAPTDTTSWSVLC